jgi:hypothetical protein
MATEPRYNKLEQKTKMFILNTIKFGREWENHNCLGIVKLRKEANNFNQIFYDCHSPYNTEYNNPRTTEFILYCPMYRIDWRIEDKSQIKLRDLNARVIKDLYRTERIPEKEYILILDGNGFNDRELTYIINDIRTHLKISNKLWIGTLEQFKTKLISQIKRYS